MEESASEGGRPSPAVHMPRRLDVLTLALLQKQTTARTESGRLSTVAVGTASRPSTVTRLCTGINSTGYARRLTRQYMRRRCEPRREIPSTRLSATAY
jgi:hypothetical protein